MDDGSKQETMTDIGYSGQHLDNGELLHAYGDHVHIMADAYHLSLLATLSSDDTTQPEINHLVTALYRDLVATVLARELPTIDVASPTRMIAHTPQGVYRGRVIDPKTRVVRAEFDEYRPDVLNVVPPQKAGLLAETMRRIRDEESVSSLYID